jgi:hypothetical protein
MNKALRIIEGIQDKHTSRKNAITHGFGPSCFCEECVALSKVIKILKKFELVQE